MGSRAGGRRSERRAPGHAGAGRAWSTSRRSSSSTSADPGVARLPPAHDRQQLPTSPSAARSTRRCSTSSRRLPKPTSRSCASARTQFRVVTGAFDGPRDEHWFRKHLPDDGSVTFVDRTSALRDHRRVGPAGARPRRSRSPTTTSPTTRSPTARPRRCFRLDHRPPLPHLLRRRAGLGDLRPDARTGWPIWDRAVGGRPGPRRRRRRRRRVRDQRSSGEGLPADGRRAGERVQPGRGRPRPAQGEVRRLHRQGGLPRGPGGGAGGDPVHADGRGPRRRRATGSSAT